MADGAVGQAAGAEVLPGTQDRCPRASASTARITALDAPGWRPAPAPLSRSSWNPPEHPDHAAEMLTSRCGSASSSRSPAEGGCGPSRGSTASRSPRPRERDHDLAVGGPLGRADNDEVALQDAGVDHALAARRGGRSPRPHRRRRPESRGSPRCSPRPEPAHPRRRFRRAAARRADRPLRALHHHLDRPRLRGSRFSTPRLSSFERCACTVDEECRPTALPISRTVGGYPWLLR